MESDILDRMNKRELFEELHFAFDKHDYQKQQIGEKYDIIATNNNAR